MTTYRTMQVSGYCPEQDKNVTISAKYAIIPPHLGMSEGYKLVGLGCAYEECPRQAKCPVAHR